MKSREEVLKEMGYDTETFLKTPHCAICANSIEDRTWSGRWCGLLTLNFNPNLARIDTYAVCQHYKVERGENSFKLKAVHDEV